MRDLTVIAVGQDRPGIVAGAARIFFDLGCNLADCSMTRLSDQFAMILLVESPDEVSGEKLLEALSPVSRRLGLDLQVLEGAHRPTPASRRPYVISVYGADHPGIVLRVTEKLAEEGVNITDLVSRIVGDDIFTMVLDVELPPQADEAALQAKLGDLARDLGVELTFRRAETADL